VFGTENEFVRWVRARANIPARGVRLGIGDDAALVRVAAGNDLVLTTDLSIEGVHFSLVLHPARSVGHRAMARSISDVAAMGGIPRFALVSLAISRGSTRAWINGVYAGMLALAGRFGVRVIGGDTTFYSGVTMVDVMVAGEVERGRALVRSGARPGDRIYVSGRLGLSAQGLGLLKSPGRHWDRHTRAAIDAHLYPEPRCPLGRFLSKKRLASAVIDLSDGLSTDLGRLAEASHVGARLWSHRIPSLSVEEITQRAVSKGHNLALHGGEDYELLFTVSPRNAARIPAQYRGVPLHAIGEIRRSKELLLVDERGKSRSLKPAGYDHFRTR
jgi:thiamine-monophosphate kinase